ncbi:Carbonic anhydrase 1 [Aphelenchoides besseyi]|nr:Carbonic anhydrase 1 [Aphelenchoides besseyi]KAI6195349.1 Carbonic anhydrase 1 [Aphelenchoides besseyi]
MAFLGQLQAKFNDLKTQIPQVVEQANKAKQNLVPVFNKGREQLGTLGKILQVNVDRKQSPIDLLPAFTAFDVSLENATFRFDYDDSCQAVLRNLGSCLSIKYPDGNSDDFGVSFIPEQFHLDTVNFHWGNEVMNGSEHVISGVGYSGEIHFIHRNLKYATLDAALKQSDGVVAVSVFLNESHGDNLNLIPLTNVLANVPYNGNESGLQGLRFTQLLPGPEKNKEFWVYEGSETIEPYRETVKWIVFRSAIPISSDQVASLLEKFRELKSTRAETELEERMNPIRAVQPLNSRLVRSSFKSAAQAELS